MAVNQFSTQVALRGAPVSREVGIIERTPTGILRICGQGVSDSNGEVQITVAAKSRDSDFFPFAFDDYGKLFSPSMAVDIGDKVRPTELNGLVYEAVTGGSLTELEPEWWEDLSGPRSVGTANLQAVKVFAPSVYGPISIELGDPIPTEIGEATGGGFYIGNIVVADGGEDDGEYAVIMAGPESQAFLPWKDPRSSTPGTGSLTNGWANTLAMEANDPVIHYAGMYCLGYDGGGFNDWYLPARDELNLAWVNRAELAALALDEDYYWSSTEFNSLAGWNQRLGTNGTQVNASKDHNRQVRPVRRIKIPD